MLLHNSRRTVLIQFNLVPYVTCDGQRARHNHCYIIIIVIILLQQSIVVFATELHGTSPTTVCQSPKLLVASIWDLPDVINCQLHEFAAELLGPVHFLSPDQQSGIHGLIICAIQLLTPNNLGGTWRRICSPNIWNASALEVLRNCALQINIYLLTYIHHHIIVFDVVFVIIIFLGK